MKAKSIKGKSTEEILTALERSMADGFIPTLAFVFVSIKQNVKAICEILDNNRIAIYGSTTHGEIVDDETSEGAISILLLDLNEVFFKVYLSEFKQTNPLETSQSIAIQAMRHYSKPAFIIACSELETNYTKLLKGFSDVVGENVNVYGGVAGDDLTITNPLVFTHNKSTKNGIVVIAFDEEKVEIKGKVVCGWNPVGTVKIVTKSKGNRIYEIDNENALDITLRYAGIKELPQDPMESNILVSRTLAFQFLREKGRFGNTIRSYK